jgi:cell division transport system ATP-binding protein
MKELTVVEVKDGLIYQNEHKVLEEVNLTVLKGEFSYLIGRTGTGKSSLLKVLYGALPLRGGNGHVAGFELNSLNRRNIPLLRRKLGIVFQDFNLLMDRSVEANLRFVLRATGWKDKKAMARRIEEALAAVNLSEKLEKMPYNLSGGEQQRVAIARALVMAPGLILADEPTGNLDPDTSDDILMLIRRLATEHNTAVLFATHDYRILEHFPARIIRCHDGRVLDEEDMVV